MKLIRAQEGVPTSQSGSPDHKYRLNWPTNAEPKTLPNSTLRSVWGFDICHAGNQPLYVR